MIDALLAQYRFSQYVLQRNTAGISHGESMIAPHEGGNCVNWILGHVVASRSSLLRLLGEEPVLGEAGEKRYARGSTPLADAADALPLSELLAAFESSQERLVSGLKRLDPAMLSDAPPPGAAVPGIETLGQSLAIHSFHESYHIGQLGALRRILGKDDCIT